MAFVLSLPSTNPLERPFTESLYMRSCSSFASQASCATVVRAIHPLRPASSASVRTIASLPVANWQLVDDISPPRLASRSLLNLIQHFNEPGPLRRALSHVPQRSSWARTITPSPVPEPSDASLFEEDFFHQPHNSYFHSQFSAPTLNTPDDISAESEIRTPCHTLEEKQPLDDHSDNEIEEQELSLHSPGKGPDALPFRRWLSTLRRRNQQKKTPTKSSPAPQLLDQSQGNVLLTTPLHPSDLRPVHRKSLSLSSSLGFILGCRSASRTLASASLAPSSQVAHWARRSRRSGHLRSDHGSSGFSEVRMSFDSKVSHEPIMDTKAWDRSVQRRSIVEELMESEESYIADMKALVNVYFTLLATVPTLTAQRRKSIQKAVTQIVQLHEELLSELQKVVPNSEQKENNAMPRTRARRSHHMRWRSAESAPSMANLTLMGRNRRLRHSIDAVRPTVTHQASLVVNTNTVLNVANVFDRFMRGFLAYEGFVAHSEIMGRDASSTSRMIPTWSAYERGIEALATSTTSINHREANSRKALTFSDLLIKPVQRLSKYPLLFERLSKETPTCDDPVAHAELQKVWFRLQETMKIVDEAKDNPRTRQLIESSWLLQDRLDFNDHLGTSKPLILRFLGHALLCGVLHVAYNTNDRVDGQYLICLLYRSSLVLAAPSKGFGTYQVVAVIALLNSNIEACDNGRGLQCHTAPYTWKLVFEFNRRHYEIIMSACSEKEEEEWKCHLRSRIAAEVNDYTEGRCSTADLFASLHLNMKSLGAAFEAHSGLARRRSIHRAATLGPKTNLHQVIIKNTHAQRLGGDSLDNTLPVMRSQSLLSSGHIPTLAPRRADRIRLEGALADVWSRDILPYPGMASRRMETHIRASANSVMRKLSMASIASNFSKRSTSFSNLSNQRAEEARPPSSQRSLQFAPPKSVKQSTGLEKIHHRNPVLVDFHNAPNAFLPEDFELKPKHNLMGRCRRTANRASLSDSYDYPITPREVNPIGTFLGRVGADSSPGEVYSICPTSALSRTPPSVRSKAASTKRNTSKIVLSTPSQENLSPPMSAGHRGPVKARSLLFKFLAMVKE